MKEIAEYVNKEYQYGSHVHSAIITKQMQVSVLLKPTDPATNATAMDKEIWKQEISAYIKKKTAVDEHVCSLFLLVLGQCMDAMKAKLEGLPNWETMQTEMNGLALIKEVKQIAFHFEATCYQPDALYDAICQFSTYHQGPDVPNAEYLCIFQSHVQVIEHCSGSIANHPGLLDAFAQSAHGSSYAALSAAKKKTVTIEAEDAYLGCVFLKKADHSQYGKLLQDLQNNFAQGQDNYPKSVSLAYNLLVHWCNSSMEPHQPPHPQPTVVHPQHQPPCLPPIEVAAFTMGSNVVLTCNGQPIECFLCGENHYANDCPQCMNNSTESSQQQHLQADTSSSSTANQPSSEEGEQHFIIDTINDDHAPDAGQWSFAEDPNFVFCTTTDQEGTVYTMTTSVHKKMPSSWLLLDNQATCDVFCNEAYLKDIQPVKSELIISTNTGVGCTNLQGILPGYGPVWYYKKGIANILSLDRVQCHFRVSYDSTKNDRNFIVHKANGSLVCFHPSTKGLHYLNMSLTPTHATVLFNTVEDNKKKYHPWDVK